VTVSTERRNADYVVRLNMRAGRSQIAVYHTNGDLLGVGQKSTLGGAVKTACELIKKDQTTSTVKPGKETNPDSTK
jgi:hypothetical protein